MIEPPEEPRFTSPHKTQDLVMTALYGLLALFVPRPEMPSTESPSDRDPISTVSMQEPLEIGQEPLEAEEARNAIKHEEMRLNGGFITKTEYVARVARILIRTKDFQDLMHDLHDKTIEAIEEVIEHEQQRKGPFGNIRKSRDFCRDF